jgi:hypothetical protein
MSLAGNVARVGGKKNAYRFWWGKFRERWHLENLSVVGKIILKWLLKQKDMSVE